MTNSDAIHIIPYNPLWPQLAELEIAAIKQTLPQDWVIDIQHIGSTAVPGLAAKPIIDIYMGVHSIAEAQQAIDPIKQLGYEFWDENPNPEKLFFVKGMPPFGQGRTHHIHIVDYDSDYWRARILFRDYLRMHPAEARRYEQVKEQAKRQYANNREAYTDSKTDFIAEILQKAGFAGKVRR